MRIEIRHFPCEHCGGFTDPCDCKMAQLLETTRAAAYRAGLEDAAAECIRIWREAPNTRPEYRQNTISHGCNECNKAIMVLVHNEAEGTGDR